MTYGVARFETSFVICQLSVCEELEIGGWIIHTTSTPRFLATAMTVLRVPKSTPTTVGRSALASAGRLRNRFVDIPLIFAAYLSSRIIEAAEGLFRRETIYAI